MSIVSPATKQRFDYLDSVRGLSALNLITWHFIAAFIGSDPHGLTTKSPLHIFWYGEADVMLFFIHSGFILAYSYTGINKPLTVASYIQFLIERIFRIYPLFLFILFLSFILKNTIFPLTAGIFTNQHLQSYWSRSYDIVTVLKEAILVIPIPKEGSARLIPQDWTLTIELVIGALIPLLAFFLRKNKWIFWVVVCMLILLFRLTFTFEFACGVFLFYHWQIIKSMWLKMNMGIKIMTCILSICLFFCFFHFCSLINYSLVLFRPGIDRLIVVSGCCLVFCIVISSSTAQKILSLPLFARIGRICYSIYLVHMVLLIIFGDYFMILLHNWFKIARFNYFLIFFIVFMAVTILISSVTYWLIEKPFNVAGKKISRSVVAWLTYIKRIFHSWIQECF